MSEGRGDEPLEKRMRGTGTGAEFGMELAGNKPRIGLQFNQFCRFSVDLLVYCMALVLRTTMRFGRVAIFLLALLTFFLGLAFGYLASEFKSRALAQTGSMIAETDTPESEKIALEPTTPAAPKESSAASADSLQPAISTSYTPVSAMSPEERYSQLQELPPEAFPTLVAELCSDIGPSGLKGNERDLLKGKLERWLKSDREAVLRWITALPPTGTKRYLMTKVLKELSFSGDPNRSKQLSEAYKLQDPIWDDSDLQNSIIGISIEAGWKDPRTTAEQMLALYQQSRSGSMVHGPIVGMYPEGFDFRKFLEGMDALSKATGDSPSLMPQDTLAAWSKQDLQQAAAWLLQAEAKWNEEGRSSLPYVDWDYIARAVAASKGPQAYYEWAAKFIGNLSERSRTMLLSAYGREGDVQGILDATRDVETRNKVLTSAIGGSDGNDPEKVIAYLKMISTPEARLNAIRSNKWRLNELSKDFVIDHSAYKQLGLTEEQFKQVLAEEN